MAGKKPYLTSDDLIESVKRTISVPLTQNTFTNEDILDFASEELFLSQVPSIMQYHEEYFATDITVPLVNNVSRYSIPDRAIGMKLRDLFFVDTSGNMYEMSNVGPSNSDIFKTNGASSNPRYYYIQGNEVVLVPDNTNTQGSLLMMYYLRPNSLVENDRAAICNSFVKTITVVNDNMVAGDTISIGDQTLIAGTDFVIGVTSTGTATNLSSAINSLDGLTASTTNANVSVFYTTLSMEFETSNEDGLLIDTDIGIKCDSIPEHFEDGMLVDILQTAGGHNTLDFDVVLQTGAISSDTIFFTADQIPSKFVVGDYVCEQHESIIPQIPSDLHMLLAQRTCARILEALGDLQGSQTQMTKIGDLEARQAVLLDNRTEGSPRKLVNRHSLLRKGKNRRIGRGIF